MGVLPKVFTQTSPDAILEKKAKAGAYGEGGLAKLAHLNEIREALVLANYADNAAAIAGGLVAGDLYHIAATGVVMVVV
tara:strand:- start:14079 stop:14315 length:237 start_codon:yes stop_codon:yes gene_type:complete